MQETPESERKEAAATQERGFGLDPELVEAVTLALDEGDAKRVADLIEPLHGADLADLVQHLGGDERRALVHALRDHLPPEVLPELDEKVRDAIIEELGIAETAAVVADLETDDAVHVIAELDEVEQQKVLEAIPATERALIEQALTYPEYSAGRLMRRELVAVPTFWTVGETIDFFRQRAEEDPDSLPTDFYDIFVVDPGHRVVGTVPLSRLLRARRSVPILDIAETDRKVITTSTDQEDVAFLFRQRDLISAPVVDEGGRLVGMITVDDVVDVIDEEHEDDIMHLGGVSEDDLYSATMETARSRFTWLSVNLATAVLASAVIGLFGATIEQMVALAVLMPIVASMGGNAGTQSLTVAVRALAMKELTPANAKRVIGKELLVGGINGLLFAVITGLIAWVWFSSAEIAVVLGLAMIANLLVAALAGTTIPLLMVRARVDPAVSSSVFLTTVTDVVGFFAFLGLATWLLL
jgi:magnesium transporter